MATITNLTGTTWRIPAGWSATAGYGEYGINGYVIPPIADEEDSFSEGYLFGIGYASSDYIATGNSIYINGSFYSHSLTSSDSFTITITGGKDATDADLIDWLYDNGELVSGGEEDELYLIDESTLTEIADAIRAKKGIAGYLDPANFASEILSIGQAPTTQTLTVINSNNPSETDTFTMPYGYTFGDFVGSEYDTSDGNFVISSKDVVEYRTHKLTQANTDHAYDITVASGTFYYYGEAAYTLSGTWVFNETISGDDRLLENVTFKDAYNQIYYLMGYVPYSELSPQYIFVDDYSDEYGDSAFNFYTDGVWHNEAYRTITFEGTQTVSKEFYDWFTANAVFYFTIEGTSYYAKAGMTWADWVADTTLNTDGYDVQDDRIIDHPNDGVHTSQGVLLNDVSTHVSPTDPIIVGYSYLYGTGD